MENQKTTRKGSLPIKVHCLTEERQQIEANARAAGLSIAQYSREVGKGYRITGVMDYEKVLELARINGDLGWLGGLLKLWLTNNDRAAQFGYTTIHAVLSKIKKTQEEMGKVMMSVVMPRKKY